MKVAETGDGPILQEWKLDFGTCSLAGGGVGFRVWAPSAENLRVRLLGSEGDRVFALEAVENGFFTGVDSGACPGEDYLFRFPDGSERPDPASRWQPQGVHGPSRILDPGAFAWRDSAWQGLPLEDYVIYELHVGTFTPEGTFAAIIPRLDYLLELGITALELMPVAQFPGERNWGYDGVYPFAPQNSYGGPEGLKELVHACHRKGLAVILDVVYNHLGPEGNYLGSFGPYFTARYRTPWGDAVNFDGPDSDPVRHYFISNALYWVTEFHIDALRLDAIHGIFDFGARHILQELAAAVHEQARLLGRRVHVIAESSLNDVRTVNPVERGGHGLDAQWNDDFHHALHTLLTGERDGYYADFGEFSHLTKAFAEGFVYTGEYSRFRRRRHGTPSAAVPSEQLVVFSQNHDQVGNRRCGDRLTQNLSQEQLKLVAGTVLLSPYIPLLFMGEEYGEPAPFPYFTHHGDPQLVAAVRQGRQEEFTSFSWQGDIPDPQARSTFLAAKIDPELHRQGTHRYLFAFYRQLLRLRREIPALGRKSRGKMTVDEFAAEKVLVVRRGIRREEVLCFFHFGDGQCTVSLPPLPSPFGKILDSTVAEWGGEGSPATGRLSGKAGGMPVTLPPWSVVLYRAE